MTPRAFCQSGVAESVKGGVHVAMLVGAVCCASYNAAAFWYRRERHNAVNLLVYSALILIELQHVRRHVG